MRARLLNLPAVARALGFILVAVAIVATALHFRSLPRRAEPRLSATREELTFAGSMQWMTSVQPSVSNAQSMAAAAPSVA